MDIHKEPISLKGGGKAFLALEVFGQEGGVTATRIEDASATHSSIFIENDRIAPFRAINKSTPIYGFWQILLHNNRIDLANHDSAIYYFDGEQNGTLLAIRDGVANGVHDVLAGSPMGVASVRRPQIINDVDLQNLTAPKHEARTVDERRAAELARARQIGIMAAIVGAAGLALMGVVDFGLAIRSDSLVKKAKVMDDDTRMIQRRTSELLQTGNPLTDDDVLRQRIFFTRVAEVMGFVGDVRLRTLRIADETDATLEVQSLPIGISFETIAYNTPPHPLTVTFSIDGSAPVNPPPPPGSR